MKKIQQLLNEHKDKLGYPDLTISIYDGGFTIRRNIHHSLPGSIISLSEILFNTPFLSWLERKPLDDGKDRSHYISGLCIREANASDYHKINLCLLDTDYERIIYIENNTL